MARNTDLIMSQDNKEDSDIDWKQILHLLYDETMFLLSVVDVVSDLMVTIQWYQAGKNGFVAVAFIIFCITTIAYAALFTIFYVDDYRSKRFRIKCFLCVLPFGQFVPLFMWLQSYRLKWINKLLLKCYLQPEGRVSYTGTNPATTHGAVLIESILEAVPMSILQMIFLVTTDGITSLYLFSAIISMISVASKGLLIAYSIDRPTFIFNFGCFVADVFNVFVTVSWLFYNNGSGDNTYHFFLFSQPINTLNAIWFYKEMILILSFATLALLAFIAFAIKFYEDNISHQIITFGEQVRLTCYVILLISLVTVLFPCIMIVIEAFKFSVFPLFIYTSVENHTISVYHQLFTWINGGKGKNEFLRRLRLVNQYLATTFLKRSPPKPADSLQLMQMKSCAQRLATISESEYSLAVVREAAGYTLEKNVAQIYTSVMQQEIKACSSAGRRLRWSLHFEIAGRAMMIYCVFPIVLISAIISIIYPIVMFIYTKATTNANVGSLQLVLSYIYFGTLVVLVALSPWVYRFKRAAMHLIFYVTHNSLQGHGLDQAGMDQVIYAYDYEKYVPHVRDTLVNDIKMIPDLVEICMSYIPNAYEQKQHDLLGDRVRVIVRGLDPEIVASIYKKYRDQS